MPVDRASGPFKLKGGFSTKDPRLDRVPEFDEASRDYRIRDYLNESRLMRLAPSPARTALLTALRRRRSIIFGPGLDQGQEGACTGFGCIHCAQSTPHRKGPFTTWEAREFYFQNQRTDEWPGGAYPGASPFYEGSSVLAGMKTGKTLGYWREYRWVGAGSQTVMQDIIDTLRYVGPISFGLWWPNSAFRPDHGGQIHFDLDSGWAGGHCLAGVDAAYMKPSYSHKYKLWIVMQQSWGPSHGITYKGVPGCVLVDPDELEPLMELDGEGGVPIR